MHGRDALFPDFDHFKRGVGGKSAFVFFIFTRPLERLILFFVGLISPRLTYFAKRNVGRSTERNTLISLFSF